MSRDPRQETTPESDRARPNPKTMTEAHKLEDLMNVNKSGSEPRWGFECGAKLDFDGPAIRISSRFFPPCPHYGETWDGVVNIMRGDTDIAEWELDEPTLSALVDAVETRVSKFIDRLKAGG